MKRVDTGKFLIIRTLLSKNTGRGLKEVWGVGGCWMQHCYNFYHVLHHRSRQFVSQLRVASVAITSTAAVVEVHLDDDSLSLLAQ